MARSRPAGVRGRPEGRGLHRPAARPQRLPDPDGVLRPEAGARGARARRRIGRAQELSLGRPGRAARLRGAVLRAARVAAAAHEADQHGHAVLHRVPGDLLRAEQGRRTARRDLLHLDRHLQPDDHRAVLVVRDRRLHEGRRRAAVPHRRVRRLARRRVRRPDRRSAHRTDRHLRADAGGGRHPARAAGADQLHQRAPCAPRRRSAGGRVDARGRGSGPAEADGRQRLRAGVPDALPAPDGADADDAQLGEQHRRVHSRPHRDRCRPAHDRRRERGRAHAGTAHRRLLLEVLHDWSTASGC